MAASHSSLTDHSKPLGYALAACLTLLGLNILGVEALYRKNIEAPLEHVTGVQNEFLETYLGDVEFLEKSELAAALNAALDGNARQPQEASQSTIAATGENAPTATPLADAGPTLNSLLYWGGTVDFGRKAPLVAAKSREFLMRYEEDWIKGRTFVERGMVKADLSIFNDLGRFQIWDVERNSPLQKIADDGEFVLPSKLPMPDTLDLLTAVKVRLMKGSIDGNPVQALKDVRKLAMLLLTTENFQLVTTGLAALDLERRAYREYTDRDWMDPAVWLPIDHNTSMRAGRAYSGTVGYLRAVTDGETFEKIFMDGRIPPGFCAAANEQLPIEYAYRSKLTGLWPFERQYRAGFIRLDRTLAFASRHCRLRALRKLHAENGFTGVDPEGPWPLTYLPYFRTLFALRDWAAWPLHFDGYQRR